MLFEKLTVGVLVDERRPECLDLSNLVAAADAEDQPGNLGATARKLAEAGVNVELFYVTNGLKLVFVVADAEKARSAL